MNDYIIYHKDLEGLWNGDLYVNKEGRYFSLHHVCPSSVDLYCNDGYKNDDLFFNSISVTLKTHAFKEFIANGDLQLVGRSLRDPWIREGDILIINNEEHYVYDIMSITDSILLDHDCYEFWELDVIINNCPALFKKHLLHEREEYNSEE